MGSVTNSALEKEHLVHHDHVHHDDDHEESFITKLAKIIK